MTLSELSFYHALAFVDGCKKGEMLEWRRGNSTAHAVVIVEGIAMLAESFLKRRYEAGLQDGRAEGREILRRWEEWNRRRLAAEARGERFEEPPPGE